MVDWESESSALFFNDRHGKKNLFISCMAHLPALKSHIWLATSGSLFQKWIALSKKALLVSAGAVNQHLSAQAKDRWGLSLPLFHVGGLSILARAHLSRSSFFVYPFKKWSAKSYLSFLKEKKITLGALVPAQVYDITKANFPCPPFLRAVIVGGGALSKALYHAGRKLNWPLLPSYGLTECASQVATAPLNPEKGFTGMTLLRHVQAKTVKGEIALKSESLLTGFVPVLQDLGKSGFQDPKKKGWYFTGDKGRLSGSVLRVLSPGQIKILGEKVNLKDLEEELMKILLKEKPAGRFILLPVPDKRRGFQMVLVSDLSDKKCVLRIIQSFNEKVSPFEKILRFCYLSSFPLTGISKISKPALLKKLNLKKPG